MKVFCFARAWWLVAVIAAGVLVAASPTAGRVVAEPSSPDWAIAQTPNPGYYGNILLGISARTGSDVWAVGVQATQTSNDTLALHWNGSTWTAVSTPNPWPQCEDGDILWGGNSLSAVDAVSANDVWAVGSECYSANTIVEHWNGSNWSLVASPRKPHGFDSTAALYDVDAISATNVWAVGYSSSSGIDALIEHYDGSSWSVVQTAPGSSGYLTSVSATGPNDVWAVGSTDSGGNVVQHFDGNAWSVVPSPQPGSGSTLDSVDARSPTDAWAVGTKRGFGAQSSTFTMHWDGSAWTEVASPNPRNTGDARNELRSVVVLSKRDAWAVGTYENDLTNFHQDRTLVLHWDGSTWSIVDSPTPGATGQLTAVASASPLQPGTSTASRPLFMAGFFSNYEKNIYDEHYTLPRTLVIR
jgi:hypothetical protein